MLFAMYFALRFVQSSHFIVFTPKKSDTLHYSVCNFTHVFKCFSKLQTIHCTIEMYKNILLHIYNEEVADSRLPMTITKGGGGSGYIFD